MEELFLECVRAAARRHSRFLCHLERRDLALLHAPSLVGSAPSCMLAALRALLSPGGACTWLWSGAPSHCCVRPAGGQRALLLATLRALLSTGGACT